MIKLLTQKSHHKNLKRFLGSFVMSFLMIQLISPGVLTVNSAYAEQEKISICHKTGESGWMYMDTPAGPSLDGHLGHGDFLFTGTVNEDDSVNTQWCIDNAPTPPAEEETATLLVTKVVSGGEMSVEDFPLFVNGMTITSGVATTTLAEGHYTVSETNNSSSTHYFGTFSGDCDANGHIHLKAGDNKSCTITNTFDENTGGAGTSTASLTVTKVVSGGSMNVNDFPLFVNGISITSGVATTTLVSGTYTISETNNASTTGYTGTFSGDCNSSGQVTLSAGQSKTCTLTNTFTGTTTGTSTSPFMVKIYKYLDGSQATASSSDSYEFPMQSSWDWTDNEGNHNGTGNYFLGLTGHGGSGAYQAFTSLMTGPADYATHEITSDVASSSQVLPIGAQCQPGKFRLLGYKTGSTLAGAQAGTLSTSSPSFTDINSERYIIVMNETCPDVTPTTGTLTVNKVVVGGTMTASQFPLFLNGMSITNGIATTTGTGTSTVTETNNASTTGYTGAFSGDCNASGQVFIGAGQNKVCTLTNTFHATTTATTTGTIIVNKVVINDNGGTGTTTNFSFILDNGSSTPFEADGSNSITVATGTHNIIEASTTGYTTTYDGCSNISVGAGETKTCTITNNDIAQCPVTSGMIVSDTNTTVSGGGNAVLLSFIHPAWTADVDGASTTAKWIWSTDPVATTTATTTVTFNRTFTVNGTSSDALLTIASDNTYRVWVNGNLVASSTDGNNFQIGTQDQYNVSSYLVDGSNTLTIEVTNQPTPDVTDPQGNPAGLLYSLSWTATDCPLGVTIGGTTDEDDNGQGGNQEDEDNDNNGHKHHVSRTIVRGITSTIDDVTPQVLGISTVNPTLIPLGQVLGATSVLPGLPNTGIGPVVSKAVKNSVSLPVLIAGLLSLAGLYVLQYRLLKKR